MKNYKVSHKNLTLSFLSFLLFLPLTPKLNISGNIYINPMEILLIIYILFSVFIFRKNIFAIHQIQIFFLSIFVIELFFTIISLDHFFDITGIMKLIKYIIYLPVLYIGYKYMKYEYFKKIVLIGILAMIVNIIQFFYSVMVNGFSIWNIKSLSSGFVNKYIEISTLSLQTIQSGAHAIWGDYCVLIFTITFALFIDKKINSKIFLFTVFLMLVNLSLSVSRTSFLTLFVVLGLLSFYYLFIIKRIKKMFLWSGILFILALVFIIINYGDSIPAVQKILYTINSFQSSGQESNISARLEGWVVALYSLVQKPYTIFIGSGYNTDLFMSRLQQANEYFGYTKFPSEPESFYLESLMYGGLFALMSLILFSYSVLKVSFKKYTTISLYFGFFFIAEIIVNITSGSNMKGDLLMFHILLIIGYIIQTNKKAKIENITNNS